LDEQGRAVLIGIAGSSPAMTWNKRGDDME
jgi:hypothetical protein